MQSKTVSTSTVATAAKKAKSSLGALARLSPEQKVCALNAIAEQLLARAGQILAANAKDLDAARPLVESGQMPESLYRRLKIDEGKLRDMVAGVHQVAALEDPTGKVTLATELDEGLGLYRVTCPIGVIGIIFESRPDALVQIASLCLKSGNAVLLKGGKEAEYSNRALFEIINEAAMNVSVPDGAMALLESREDVMALLGAEGLVDLIVPRGSNALVRYVQQNTAIPVLGHAEGICHIYVDENADLDKAMNITLDAKLSYPAACNAVETLLIHRRVAREFLPRVVTDLNSRGIEVRVDERSIDDFGLSDVIKATEQDWSTEYGDLILAIKVVETIQEAIEHINQYGSHHTEAIITENEAAFERFFAEVDSAGVYLNASTRFADGYRYGFGAEVGISTGKLHPRGPVGLDGLVTYKYKLVGSGQTAAMYSGPKARRFTLKPLTTDERN